MASTPNPHGPPDTGVAPMPGEAIVSAMSRADSHLATKADLERVANRMLIAQLAIAGLLFAALRLT